MHSARKVVLGHLVREEKALSGTGASEGLLAMLGSSNGTLVCHALDAKPRKKKGPKGGIFEPLRIANQPTGIGPCVTVIVRGTSTSRKAEGVEPLADNIATLFHLSA